MAHALYDQAVKKIDGIATTMGAYEGKVLLIVNVASECGLTPQYSGLEKLYETYQARGLVVMGFPANEFGAQEPGTNSEVAQFCRSKFGVQFPMFEKVVVKGPGQHPLFKLLTKTIPKGQSKPGEDFDAKINKGKDVPPSNDIRWNFEKFLVDRHGNIVGRFMPDVAPQHEILTQAIEKFLG